MCGCAGRRRRRGDAGGADGAPTPRDGAYAQPGGEEGRRDSPPPAPGPRRTRGGAAGDPPRRPRAAQRGAGAERVSRRALPLSRQGRRWERGRDTVAPESSLPERPGVGGGDTYSSAGCSPSVTNFGEGEQLLRVLI